MVWTLSDNVQDECGHKCITDEHDLAIACVLHDGISEEDADKNGRLLAAAPDMLAALEQINREQIAGLGSSYGETREMVRRAIVRATLG